MTDSVAGPVRVLLVSPKPPPRGGISTWTETVLAGADRRPDVQVRHVDIAPRWREGRLARFLPRVLGGVFQGCRDVQRVRRSLRREGVQVLHITTSGSLALVRDIAVLWLARRCNIPAFLHLHFGRTPSIVRRRGLEFLLLRLAARLAAGVIAVDKPSRDALAAALPAATIWTVPNPLVLDPAGVGSSRPGDATEVLYVGRISKSKGIRELVEAWAGLSAAGCRLVLAGPGDAGEVRRLRAFVQRRGMGDRIWLLGELPRARVLDRLREADIVVHPSHTEGFPYVIAEAMAYGRAIVATTVGAIPEMLDHDGSAPCGILVPPRDAEQLRSALEVLIHGGERRAQLGRLARDRVVRSYDSGAVLDRLVALWKQATLSRAAGRVEHVGPGRWTASAGAGPAANAVEPLEVLLISPKPPPQGGIATWTQTVLDEGAGRADVALRHVDIAPRWRQIHQLGYARRLVGGAFQGLADVLRVRSALRISSVRALSITSAGSLAGIRDCVVLAMARRRGIPGYYHLRFGRLPEIIHRHGWEWRLLRRAIHLSSHVVVLDRPSLLELKSQLPLARVQHIPNCISLDGLPSASPAAAPGMLEILYIGWMVPAKGVRELVEAWSEINTPASRLVLVGPGDGKLLRSLRDVADSRGAGSRLDITGELPHDHAMQRLMRAAIFVLPSYTEGFPNVILEAMAYGKAIVATTVGSIPEILDGDQPEPCGVLVPPREPEQLRMALSALLADPDRRKQLGSRARRKVEAHYETAAVFDRLVELWRGPTDVSSARAVL